MVVLTGLVLVALVPASATADLSYTQGFLDSAHVDERLSDSTTNWEGSGAWGFPYVGPHIEDEIGGIYAINTPDGDGHYVQNTSGQSSPKYAIAKVGEYTISAGDRGLNTTFTADWASSHLYGLKFIAQVAGTWYGSETFGTVDATNGDMDQNGVKEWVTDTSVNVDAGIWYEILPGKSLTNRWSDPTWDTTALTGVPAGDITQFGMTWDTYHNHNYSAVDNFRVTGTENPAQYWQGGSANWATAGWTTTPGTPESLTPAAGTLMHIDEPGTVTVAASFISGGTGPAGKITVGATNAATLAVSGGFTLESTLGVVVETNGTLQVDGTQTGGPIVSTGAIVTGAAADLSGVALVDVRGGSLTTNGNLTVADMAVSGGTFTLNSNTLTADNLTVNGNADLSSGTVDVAGNVNLVSGTLTVAGTVIPEVVAFKGGAFSGTINPTVGYEVHNVPVAMDLAGSAGLTVFKNNDRWNGPDPAELSGNNTYAGKTVVGNQAVLVVTDLDKNIGVGALELNNGHLKVVSATEVTIARNLGTGDGEMTMIGNSGFIVDAPKLTLEFNGGADLNWADFGGLGTFNMELLRRSTGDLQINNAIDTGGRWMNFNFGNSRAVDVILSGNITGNSHWKLERHKSGNEADDLGMVWFAGDTNVLSRVEVRDGGIIRFAKASDGSSNMPAGLNMSNDFHRAILETSGTHEFIGVPGSSATPNTIRFREGGGFSAYGAPLTVKMTGPIDTNDPWNLSDDANNFSYFMLNTRGSNNVVTIQGTIENGTREDFYIDTSNNLDSEDDMAVLESNWDMGSMRLRGNNVGGITELATGYTITTSTAGSDGVFRLEQTADFRVNGTLDASAGGDVIVTGNSKLGGAGTVYGFVEVQGGSTIAPGSSSGTLTINGDLQLDANAAYECEADDLIAVTGDLDVPAGDVTVELMDSEFKKGGTMPIFTYGSFNDDLGNLVLDTTALVDSGLLNQTEADALFLTDVESEILLNGLSGTSPALPGDANNNGFVDDDDLAILLSNWESDPGTITTWALGDFTSDTDVDDDDLAVLLGNWTGPAPGGAAVPEPATLALLGLGGLTVLRRRRK